MAEGTVGGQVALLRRNESLLEVEHAAYPYALQVSLQFKNVGEAGIPHDDAELTRADATEEAIADALFESFGGLFALSVTTNGNRDIFIMLDRPVDASLIELTIQKANPQIDYSLDFMQDPKWQPYVRLYK